MSQTTLVSSCSDVMDPVTTQALADLKEFFRDGQITFAQWLEGSAAIRREAAATRPAPVAVAAVSPPADDFYDETMAHIARERARNERNPAHVPTRRRLLRP